jgi:hypothetical protein
VAGLDTRWPGILFTEIKNKKAKINLIDDLHQWDVHHAGLARCTGLIAAASQLPVQPSIHNYVVDRRRQYHVCCSASGVLQATPVIADHSNIVQLDSQRWRKPTTI